MDVAIADLIHSNLLPFSLSDDAKLVKIIDIARHLPEDYKPPDCHAVGGPLMNALYKTNWDRAMETLLSESSIFEITAFGDGATISAACL